jgi:hypothetical protein
MLKQPLEPIKKQWAAWDEEVRKVTQAKTKAAAPKPAASKPVSKKPPKTP